MGVFFNSENKLWQFLETAVF
ncbi:hypothetical protein CP03DC29_0582A, partial [Chlamydia psittaci 03DC29]